MKKHEDKNKLHELPTTWIWTTTSDTCSSVRDGTHDTPEYVKDGIPLVTSKHLKDGTIDFSTTKHISIEDHKQISIRSGVENGDVLFAMIGTIGNPIVVDSQREFSIKNVALFKKNEAVINSYYFKFWLSSYLFQKILERQALIKGTTQKFIPLANLRALPVPLPPLNEQRRLVTKIEALKTRSQRAKDALSSIPALLEQFRQSVLAAAFRGALTADWREKNSNVKSNSTEDIQPLNLAPPVVIGEIEAYTPPGWSWTPLVDIAKLESGHTPRKSVPEYWENGDVPWICLQDIRAAHGKIINETLFMPTILGIKNSSARLLPEGTVCFSRDISVGFVTIMGRSMATTQHFANWICSSKLFNQYLMYAFMTARSSLIQLGEGTTVRTLYMPALKRMQVILPPLEEQKEIVHQIQLLFKLADTIEQQYQQSFGAINQLDQSILAEAFRGALVPQDPNDEPASVLLERIRAEREKNTGATSKRSKKSVDTSPSQNNKNTGAAPKRSNKSEPFKEAIQMELELE